MSSAFIEATEAARRSLGEQEVADEDDTIKEMMVHVDAAMKIFKEELQTRMEEALLSTLIEGGKLASATAKSQEDFRTAQVVLSFNVEDTAAATWARSNAATMVKGVSDVTQRGMQEAIALGFEDGIAPKKLSRNLQNMIGLSEFDAAAVSAVSAQSGASAGAALADRLIKRRSNVIARTETIRAANAGQSIFWQQAVNNGLLTGMELREWIVTPDDRLCEICEPMEGQRVGLNDEFETGDGDRVFSPPAHPSCRCAVGLTDKTDKPEVEKLSPIEQISDQVCDNSPEWCPPKLQDDIVERTDAQNISALDDYTTNSFNLNDALRGGLDLTDEELEIKEGLNSLISKSDPLENPRIVYRGIPREVLNENDLAVGGRIEDLGFVSTTANREIVSQFTEDLDIDGVELKITLGQGVKALDVNSVLGNEHDFAFQEETILPSGSKFIITGVNQETISLQLLKG